MVAFKILSSLLVLALIVAAETGIFGDGYGRETIWDKVSDVAFFVFLFLVLVGAVAGLVILFIAIWSL